MNKLIKTTAVICALVLWVWLTEPALLDKNHDTLTSVDTTITTPKTNVKPPAPILSELTSPTIEPTSLNGQLIDCSTYLPESTALATTTIQTFIESLNDSTEQDSQFIHATYNNRPIDQARIERLNDYHQQYPQDALALLDLVGICALSAHKDNPICTKALIEKTTTLEKNNGAAWFGLANLHASKNDRTATINAIEQVIDSPLFDEYFYQGLERFMQVIAGSTVTDFTSKAMVALGYQAAKPMYIGAITNFCGDEIKNAGEAKQLCFALAEDIAKRSKTLLNQTIGLSLQKTYHQTKQELEKATALQSQIDNHYKKLQQPQYSQASLIALLDRGLFLNWINNLNQFGEVASSTWLINEARLLSENQSINPCAADSL
jgi:hypothetical protein